jgi:hypothetical protein
MPECPFRSSYSSRSVVFLYFASGFVTSVHFVVSFFTIEQEDKEEQE